MDAWPESGNERRRDSLQAGERRQIVEQAKANRGTAREVVVRTRNVLQWSWLLRALRERLHK
jgi:hypothetical protein